MKVVWTPNAELSYAEELEFINSKWSIHKVIRFMNLTDAFIEKLASGIIEGKISKSTNIRSFVISKQTILFFEVHQDIQVVELLLFWNTKQNPKKLKEKLKK